MGDDSKLLGGINVPIWRTETVLAALPVPIDYRRFATLRRSGKGAPALQLDGDRELSHQRPAGKRGPLIRWSFADVMDIALVADMTAGQWIKPTLAAKLAQAFTRSGSADRAPCHLFAHPGSQTVITWAGGSAPIVVRALGEDASFADIAGPDAIGAMVIPVDRIYHHMRELLLPRGEPTSTGDQLVGAHLRGLLSVNDVRRMETMPPRDSAALRDGDHPV